jgi:hypothetical protein
VTTAKVFSRAAAVTALAIAGTDTGMDINDDNDGVATNDPSTTNCECSIPVLVFAFHIFTSELF